MLFLRLSDRRAFTTLRGTSGLVIGSFLSMLPLVDTLVESIMFLLFFASVHKFALPKLTLRATATNLLAASPSEGMLLL